MFALRAVQRLAFGSVLAFATVLVESGRPVLERPAVAIPPAAATTEAASVRAHAPEEQPICDDTDPLSEPHCDQRPVGPPRTAVLRYRN